MMHQVKGRLLQFASFQPVSCLLLAALLLSETACTKAARQERHIKRGNEYFQAGDLEKAEIEYLNVLKTDPRNIVAVPKLASIYYDQGRVRSALHLLARTKDLLPDDLDSRVKLAGLVTAIGQGAKAREDLLAILAKNPKHDDAIVLLSETSHSPAEIAETRGMIQKLRQQIGDRAGLSVAEGMLFLRQSNHVAAEQAFSRARTLDPKNPQAHLGLGIVAWQGNDLAKAEQMFKTGEQLAGPRALRQMPWTDFKIKTGGTKEAQAYLEEFVKKTPDYIPALNHLAELQLESGKTNECQAHATKVLAMDPENFEARALLGRLKTMRGQFAEAVLDFEHLRTLYPKLSVVHFNLGRAYLLNRELPKAIASLEEAVSLDPNLYAPALILADLKTRQGEAAPAIDLLSNIVKKRPKDEQAWYLLATAYRVGKRPDEALNIYRRLARDFPTNPLAQLSIGDIQRQEKKPVEARKAFDAALQISPNHPSALVQLVELDVAQTNLAAALTRAQQAVAAHPKSPQLQLLLGKVYLAKGDQANAEAALRKTLELAPDFREPYILLARIFMGNKQPDQALAELGKVMAKNPKDTRTLLMMGIFYESKGDYAKARDTYEKLLEIDPQFGLALNNLAYIYAVRLKQPDKGVELARKARQLMPNDPAVADTLGWLTYLRGDYPAALPLLQESASKLPDEPEAQFHLGMALYMMGTEGPARDALQRAVQSGGDFAWKDEARQRLLALGGQGSLPPSEMIPSLEKALSQQPNDLLVLTRLAALYEQTGALDKAQSTAEKALKLNPKAVRALLVMARIHAAKQEGPRALEYARNARLAAPNDTEVAQAAGRAAFQAGQYEWAHTVLQDTYRKESDDPELAYDFAWSTYVVGRVPEAETAMQNALRGGTNFSRAALAQRFLGMVALTRETARLTQEGARIQETLKNDSAYLPALMAAGMAWEQQKGYPEAKKYYDQILARYPQFTPAIRNLALIYANHLDDAPKGYELATKARQALPNDTEITQALGKLAFRRGEHENASRLLREVLQRNKATAETYFYLGLSQAQLKQKAESTSNLQKALSLNLDPKLAEEARRALNENK